MEFNKILEINNVEIGVSQKSNWFFRKGQHIYENGQTNGDDFILWLPILEASYNDVKTAIHNTLMMSLNIDKNEALKLVSAFPVRKILQTALYSNSEYWVKLALNWLSDINDLKDYSQELINVTHDKSYSQKTRHRALRLLPKTR